MTAAEQVARKNGPLNDEQTKAVEAGLAMHLRVKGDLDLARLEITQLRETIAQNAVELESLRSFNNLLESRVTSATAARDLAIGQRAQYEALFSMIHATMREFNVPAVPLVREVET